MTTTATNLAELSAQHLTRMTSEQLIAASRELTAFAAEMDDLATRCLNAADEAADRENAAWAAWAAGAR